MSSFIVRGIFADTPSIGELRIRKGELLIENGCISEFKESFEKSDNLKVYDFKDKIIVPGLIDLHLHAPQYSYSGTAMDLELLDWLNKYTFPEEAKYKDINYAKEQYEIFVGDLVKCPSTRFCVFASIHCDSTIELMDQFEKSGLIAYVGKVCMNRNSPDFYTESTTENGMKETTRWLDELTKKNYKNVFPIITPRFTISVTDDYMKQLGELANTRNIAAQSHLSENNSEIEFVKELCPDTKFYGETYSRYGLFGDKIKTVMAHCVHCPLEESKLIKDNKVFIAFCPTSNDNLSSGICPAAKYLREEYNIGLGSDVAGGDTINLFDVMKTGIQSSKMYWKYINKEVKAMNFKEALYIATYGGGRFFGKVGLFEKGFEFDAIVLDEKKIKNKREFNVEERLEKFIYLGKGEISNKFVKGRVIF